MRWMVENWPGEKPMTIDWPNRDKGYNDITFKIPYRDQAKCYIFDIYIYRIILTMVRKMFNLMQKE